MSTSII